MLEAQASRQDEAGRDAEALFAKLEGRYVDREIQANNRLLRILPPWWTRS